jgi:hypothetical protein
MATRFQLKRSTVSGVIPTTIDIANGELAINLPDRKLFTSNGSSVYEVGSNLTNLAVTGKCQYKCNYSQWFTWYRRSSFTFKWHFDLLGYR